MKLVSTSILAACGLIAANAQEACPSYDALPSSPFKFRWKENYDRKKIGTFKVKRRRYEAQLTKQGVIPDYTQTGWTLVLQFDRPITHGAFHLNVGNGLSTNKDGSILAFHSHEWNKDLLEVKKHWFEFIFDFNQDLGFDFDVIDVKVLAGEYDNVQCMFDGTQEFPALGVASADGETLVSHIDPAVTFSSAFNAMLPRSCLNDLSLFECPCDNGTGDFVASCGTNNCVACDDGFDLLNGLCNPAVVLQDCHCDNGTGDSLEVCTGSDCTACADGFNLENGVCNAEVVLQDCQCDNGTGDSLEVCTGRDCTACDDTFVLTEGACVSQADNEAANEVEARLNELGAATCAADALDCLSITIMWDNTQPRGRADLDLWVTTPSGNKVYWREKNIDNGVLDIDNTETADNGIENIIFATGAPSGEYLVQVQEYAASGSEPMPFILALQKPGETVRTIHNLSTTGGVYRELIDVDTFTI